ANLACTQPPMAVRSWRVTYGVPGNRAVQHNRVAAWRQEIVGDWRPELCGLDLLHLEPAAGKFDGALRIHADGTWDDATDRPALPADLPARFRWPWELSDDRVLSLWTPIP